MNFNFFKKKTPPITEEKESNPLNFLVRYTYEWKENVPEVERDSIEHPSRPFCKFMLEKNRFYNRVDIQKMGAKLGYNLYEEVGGENCRHYWKTNIVERK